MGAVSPEKLGLSLRVPAWMYHEIEEVANERGVDKTTIVVDALDKYLFEIKSLRCQQCGSVNPKGSKYCCDCGAPFGKESAEKFAEMQRMISENPDMFLRILESLK